MTYMKIDDDLFVNVVSAIWLAVPAKRMQY